MASSYSQYRIELIGTGEQSGTWGTTTNNNFGSATPGTYRGFEQAIGGKADIDMDSTTKTLSLTDSNAPQDARALYLNLTGTPGGAADLVVPAIQKGYLVKNGSNQVVTVKVTGQTGVAVPVGKTMWLYNNGTDVVNAIDNLPSGATVGGVAIGTGSGTVTSVSGTGTVNGISLSGTVTSSGNITLGGALANVDLTTQITGTLPVANGGTGITSFGTGVATALGQNVTGSGGIALATSPSFTTPVLGTPTSGTLTNCTGLPVATGISDLGTGVATFLGTPSSANLAAAVTDETGSGSLVFATSPTLVTPALGTPASGNLESCTVDGTVAVGFRTIPQNSQSAAYTLVAADSGKHILHPASDNNARTFTIPANSSVAFPIGTAITFVNRINTVTIAITDDTLRLADTTDTGSMQLAVNGVATCIKIGSTEWIISGVGLTKP